MYIHGYLLASTKKQDALRAKNKMKNFVEEKDAGWPAGKNGGFRAIGFFSAFKRSNRERMLLLFFICSYSAPYLS